MSTLILCFAHLQVLNININFSIVQYKKRTLQPLPIQIYIHVSEIYQLVPKKIIGDLTATQRPSLYTHCLRKTRTINIVEEDLPLPVTMETKHFKMLSKVYRFLSSNCNLSQSLPVNPRQLSWQSGGLQLLSGYPQVTGSNPVRGIFL